MSLGGETDPMGEAKKQPPPFSVKESGSVEVRVGANRSCLHLP